MHYYDFNIADYRKDTVHLKPIEHYVYRTLIDWYYLDETPIPKITQVVMRRLSLGSDDEEKALLNVLSDFFVEQDDGFHHLKIDSVIENYHSQNEKNRENGKKGGRPPKNNPNESETKPKQNPSVISDNPNESETNPNQEPRTINHKPITNNPTAPVTNSEVVGEICQKLRGLGVNQQEQRQKMPEITALVHRGATFDDFADYLEKAKASNAKRPFAYGLTVMADEFGKPQQARASPPASRIERLSQVKDNSLADRVAAQLAEQKHEPKTIEVSE